MGKRLWWSVSKRQREGERENRRDLDYFSIINAARAENKFNNNNNFEAQVAVLCALKEHYSFYMLL